MAGASLDPAKGGGWRPSSTLAASPARTPSCSCQLWEFYVALGSWSCMGRCMGGCAGGWDLRRRRKVAVTVLWGLLHCRVDSPKKRLHSEGELWEQRVPCLLSVNISFGVAGKGWLNQGEAGRECRGGLQGGKSDPSQRSQPHPGGRGQKGYPLAPAQSRLKFRGLKEREV